MKLRTLEYSISSYIVGGAGINVIANHSDGEKLEFYVCKSTGSSGNLAFMSRDIIAKMRAGDSAGARELTARYRAIFLAHRQSISSGKYFYPGLNETA